MIEDKANGSAIIEVMRKKYPFVLAIEPKGGKLSRAQAVAPLFEAGTVHLPDRPWIEEYKAEMYAFPNSEHDDEIDSTSQALMKLINITIHNLTKEEMARKQEEDEEYERTRKGMGLDFEQDDFLNNYTMW